MKFKWLTVPSSNETKDVQVVELWEVRWFSRYNEYSSGLQPEMAAFPSREQAEEFVQSLENAFRLIRHTSGTRVSLNKAK